MSAKSHPWGAPFRGPKRWQLGETKSVLYGGWRKTFGCIVTTASLLHRLVCGLALPCRKSSWFLFLFGPALQIHCCNFLNVCTLCFELNVASLAKNRPESAHQTCCGVCCHCHGKSATMVIVSSVLFTALKIMDPGCNNIYGILIYMLLRHPVNLLDWGLP